MESRPRYRYLAAGGVSAVGLLTLFGHFSHLHYERTLYTATLGVALPIALSLLVVSAGVWLYASDLDHRRTVRVAVWSGVGMVCGIMFGYPVIPYQATHGVTLVDTTFLVANWATTGTLGGFVIGFYDARQRQYRAALEAERNELAEREHELERENERLETFASLLSHDLRNPLTVASSYLELVRETGDGDHLDQVETSLKRMESIVDDMLTLAREGQTIREEDLDTVSLRTIAIDSWTTTETVDAELEVESDRQLRADASRLKHVFENLYRNAVDHNETPVAISVGALPSGDGFYVEDDGSGIAQADRDRVFEPGLTTSPDGTGYGLYIVRTIADAHGWSIRVEQSESGGARFEFTGVQ